MFRYSLPGYVMWLVAGLLLQGCGAMPATPDTDFFLLDGALLQESKSRWQQRDPSLVVAVNALRRNAERALTNGPYTVTEKTQVPPSGDRHDYLNYAGAWWPNPDANAKRRWMRRDGDINPDNSIDAPRIGKMANSVETLGLAWYITGDERFAAHAAHLLRVWFFASDTRMNPNAAFSGMVPDRKTGVFAVPRMSNVMVSVINGVQLIESSAAWREDDRRKLATWTGQFLHWMENSKQGNAARAKQNNHGTHYDLLSALLALYGGDRELARQRIEDYRLRMDIQFARDGSQPQEMDRSNNLGYHRYNLQTALYLAKLSEKFATDSLWQHRTSAGVSLRDALEFLAPFATGDKRWRAANFGGMKQLEDKWLELYRTGARVYDGEIRLTAQRLAQGRASDSVNLTFPQWAGEYRRLAATASVPGGR